MSSIRPGRAVRFVRSGLALVACGLLVGTLGVTSPAGASPQTPLRNVVVVGDSITDLASTSIESVVGAPYQTFLVYKDGQRIDQMLPGLSRAMASHPPVFAVVENLGTNDAIQGGRHVDWRSSWARLLSITARVPCVVLTTINPSADVYGKRPIALAMNRQIEALAKSDPRRYKVVDWHGFLAEAWAKHRATFFDYLQRTLIHEFPPGARWIAQEDRAALADCGAPAQPAIIPPSTQLLDP